MEPQPTLPPPEISKRGRGATLNPVSRFQTTEHVRVDDGWEKDDDAYEALRTSVTVEWAKSIISRNQSPDLPFDRSINPYRGCEHGCIYCYARPSHAYMDLSPGLDFESKLFEKPNAPDLLWNELGRSQYECAPIALGTNTDPYQPIEKDRRITREILKVLAKTKHPFTITTKSDLVLRDLDILQPLAKQRLVTVGISLTSLNNRLSRTMEPRASAPHKRLKAIRKLSDAGIPVVAQMAPVIPAVNDMEMEQILKAAKENGASDAIYLLLRLPREVSPLFRDWLQEHFPDRAAKVMSLIQSMRKGSDYDPDFRTRMRGQGAYADLIANRFTLACRKYGLKKRKHDLATDLFKKPTGPINQYSLFDD
ncbi:PA0069 family radical SAM protein [Sneathiella sp.]|jgi:DNA repair photolyase|uniref:PA0069 family radical SAM protein n=1 Tax=Sneathiella sp. TaxID=1964365 RepID=UPI0039E2390E